MFLYGLNRNFFKVVFKLVRSLNVYGLRRVSNKAVTNDIDG